MKHAKTKIATKQRADTYLMLYYEMGPDRSLEKLQERVSALGLRKALNTLKRWSAEYGWQKRIVDLELQQQAAYDEQAIKQVAEMNDRHASQGKALSYVGQGGLEPYLKLLNARQPIDISPTESANLVKVGQYVERLARGQATSRTEIYIEVLNNIVLEFAAIFMEVNALADPEDRKNRYAQQCDAVLTRYGQQLPRGERE